MEKRKLSKMRKNQLLELAKKLKIIGRYAYTKDELIQKIVKKQARLPKRKSFSSKKKEMPKTVKKPIERPVVRKKLKVKKTVFPKKIIEERPPRPYWQAPTEVPQGTPQPQEISLKTIPPEEKFRFPHTYGEDKIVVLVRDPWWIYAYWEVTPAREAKIRKQIGDEAFSRAKTVLRVYDVTDIIFDGRNAHSYFDIEIQGGADNWYINVGRPERAWCVDIGIISPEGNFLTYARSNIVRTPRFGMSEVTDEEWLSWEEDYWRLFGVAGGFGFGSSPLKIKREFRRRFQEEVSSGLPWSLFSLRKEKKERKFGLALEAELILYGATEPDAKVTVQGKPIKLRGDGTFTLRFALPDGKQFIPVEATSFDGTEKRKITPVISRYTKYSPQLAVYAQPKID